MSDDGVGSAASWPTLSGRPPLVIAHRGASGYLPEHTLEAYAKAIELGADFIEPDLVSTKDGVLVARHAPMLSESTDIATRSEFVGRKTTRLLDGCRVTDWFACDFTFAEIRRLRTIQPVLDRDPSYNGRFAVASLAEIVALAQKQGAARGRAVGIYPETKHPGWHRQMGLALEEPLLRSLAEHGWMEKSSPVIVQSFEHASLKELRAGSDLRLVQLLGGAVTREQLAEIVTYADGIGVPKTCLVSGCDGDLPMDVIGHAHAIGLFVHAYAFDEADDVSEYRRFYALGVDGVFSDYPDLALAAR
jgi:glycerophosphoryl diester phosphodiesterase